MAINPGNYDRRVILLMISSAESPDRDSVNVYCDELSNSMRNVVQTMVAFESRYLGNNVMRQLID